MESQNGFGSEMDEDDLNGGGMDRRATRVGPDVESGDGAAEAEDGRSAWQPREVTARSSFGRNQGRAGRV